MLTFPCPSMCFLFAHLQADLPPAQQGQNKRFSVPKTRSQKEIAPKPHLLTVRSCISHCQWARTAKPWEMLPIFNETHPDPWAELISVPQKSERIAQGVRSGEIHSFISPSEIFNPPVAAGEGGKGALQIPLDGFFGHLFTEKKKKKKENKEKKKGGGRILKCYSLDSVQPE